MTHHPTAQQGSARGPAADAPATQRGSRRDLSTLTLSQLLDVPAADLLESVAPSPSDPIQQVENRGG
jgi:hypothetical protein